MFKYISLQDISGFFQHYFVKRFLRGYFFAFAGLLKKKAAVVVCCAWGCAKADTNNRNEETHFLFIAVIDVTSKTVVYTSFVGDSPCQSRAQHQQRRFTVWERITGRNETIYFLISHPANSTMKCNTLFGYNARTGFKECIGRTFP